MGWNGSENKKATPVPKKTAKMPPSKVRGLIALVLVVAGGIAAWIALRPATPTPEAKQKAPSPKREIAGRTTPIVTNKVVEAEEPEPKSYADMSREERLQYFRDKYGNNIPDSLKPTVYYLENPPQREFRPSKPQYDYFKHKCERRIASLLMTKPGTFFMRPPEFDSRFDEEFMSAAIEKVEILDDDPDDVRELKQAVQETKEELIRRVKDGEKASDIMRNEGKALYDLGMYRQELREEIGKVTRNPDMTDDDVRDFVKAANQMLEKKGAHPLSSPNFMFRQASLARAAERRKNQAANKSEKENEK